MCEGVRVYVRGSTMRHAVVEETQGVTEGKLCVCLRVSTWLLWKVFSTDCKVRSAASEVQVLFHGRVSGLSWS